MTTNIKYNKIDASPKIYENIVNSIRGLIETGELKTTQGKVTKHPGMRVAYIAQHAFFHLEGTLELAKESLGKDRSFHGSFGTGVERDCGNACEFFGMGILI